MPFVVAGVASDGAAVRDTWAFDLVALLVLGALSWLLARRAQREAALAVRARRNH